ncbi:hypothetical protein AVEN_79403-1 [Araneus ventricosus]|uniref:Uncharacterized protein n=1 Tax=Araneus ventricosus TaxID=182803 RepID=A0A4Y2R0N2_ARAVE|nr:hypothetical protein AVEN_79403-1 [Araneus ventricosus]
MYFKCGFMIYSFYDFHAFKRSLAGNQGWSERRFRLLLGSEIAARLFLCFRCDAVQGWQILEEALKLTWILSSCPQDQTLIQSRSSALRWSVISSSPIFKEGQRAVDSLLPCLPDPRGDQ